MKRDLGGGVTFETNRASGVVVTRFADGFECTGTRPDTPENRAEAAEQGYDGNDALWDSLVAHELGHTLVSRMLLGGESRVLRVEAGAEKHRYALRLHEEALVLSLQHYMNGGGIDPVLLPHAPLLLDLERQVSSLVREFRNKASR